MYAHIVFSTKHRTPFLIDKTFRNQVHSFICGILTNLDSQAIIAGGMEDHIHILCSISKKNSISFIIGELKRSSSIWIKKENSSLQNFYWQNGYGAFSVGRSELKRIQKYIANQEKHHTKNLFQNEYKSLLIKNEIEFDERYVWD
jgi:REP element-mobilizing transposase RayT